MDFITPALKIIERILAVIPFTPKEKRESQRYKDEKKGKAWIAKLRKKLEK